ncbi:MAG: ubiquitin carboxyl-terminal hydrolase [Alphaproteobacteria bacterium]|nr:ubiquitin carboxyl-terminal hydrolase [Alphaproteobacteria bacterium]
MRQVLVANMTVILQITNLCASELDIASLDKDIEIRESYQDNAKSIQYLTDRYRKHVGSLSPRANWTKDKLYKESINTVILSEMCRAFNNINVYEKSARYNSAGDVMEFDTDEGFKTRDLYDKSNWNYVVLMNTLNYIVNQNGDVSDKSVSTTVTKLKKKYSAYSWIINEAGNDIKQYMNDLRLYDFIKSVRDNITVASNNEPLLPRGIKNEGCTCYFNAIIQMLYSSEKFRNAIKELSKSKKNGVAIELNKFFTEIAKPDKDEAKITDGKKEIWRLTNHEDWTTSNMQDAEEILTSLLDRLIDDEKEDELKKDKKNTTNYEEKAQIDERIRASSTIGSLVRRRDVCLLLCEKCQKPRASLESNNILQCAIKHDQLKENIDEYEIIENTDEEMECNECKTKTKHKKALKYWELPEILLIQLKRFIVEAKQTGKDKEGKTIWDYNKRKNDEKVICPDELKIIEKRYKLRAWVVHYGSPDAGHYWTEAYAKNGQAYEANDSKVRKITDINKKDAYILMYERIDK